MATVPWLALLEQSWVRLDAELNRLLHVSRPTLSDRSKLRLRAPVTKYQFLALPGGSRYEGKWDGYLH